MNCNDGEDDDNDRQTRCCRITNWMLKYKHGTDLQLARPGQGGGRRRKMVTKQDYSEYGVVLFCVKMMSCISLLSCVGRQGLLDQNY